MINVTYQGTEVYIQHVDEEKEMARIFPVHEPQNEQTVPLHSLSEQ